MKAQVKGTIGLLVTVLLIAGCVQVQTGNDVVDAASAVATGVYLQKKIDAQQAKSGKPDIFKSKDPKVKDIDDAIEKARRQKQPEVTAKPESSSAEATSNAGTKPTKTSN